MLPESKTEYLRRYCSLGFAVIPLAGKTKKPRWETWQTQGTSDVDRVMQIWQQYPEDNIGIVLGKPSNCWVLDCDLKHGGMETLEGLERKHGLIETLRATTGSGGAHLYWRLPSFDLRTQTKPSDLPGCEIRSTGAQVVAAPSIHPDTGNLYDWDMADDYLDRDHILDPPEWLLEMLSTADTRRQLRKETERPLEKIGKGGRHMTMVSMAGILRHRMGATQNEIEAFLQMFNANRNDPPYERQHVTDIAKSMMKYQPDDLPLVKAVSRLYSRVREDEKQRKDFEDKYKPIKLTEIMRGNFVAPSEVIKDLVHVGLTILAGAPKIGKSFLTLQMGIAVSKGAPLFGTYKICRPGLVAYVELEENEAQTHSKVTKINEDHSSIDEVEMYYRCPRLLDGGAEVLQEIMERTRPTLMVIDSYKKMATENAKGGDIVQREYDQMDILGKLAKNLDVAIVLIHHTNKLGEMAGTHGIMAAADCVSKIKADGSLYLWTGEGREIAPFSLGLKKEIPGVGWFLVASGEEAKTSDQRQAIFDLLLDEGPLTPGQIASKLKWDPNNTRQLVKKMKDADQLYKDGDGKYRTLGSNLYY